MSNLYNSQPFQRVNNQNGYQNMNNNHINPFNQKNPYPNYQGFQNNFPPNNPNYLPNYNQNMHFQYNNNQNPYIQHQNRMPPPNYNRYNNVQNNQNHYNQNRNNFHPSMQRNQQQYYNNNSTNNRNYKDNQNKITKKPEEILQNKEEIKLWVQNRKRNYPSKQNEERKARENISKEEGGDVVSPKLSQLETKLRKKIKILNSQFDNKSRIKEKYWNDLKYFMYMSDNNPQNNEKSKPKDIIKTEDDNIPEDLKKNEENNEQMIIKTQDKPSKNQRKKKKYLEKMQKKLFNTEKTIGELENLEEKPEEEKEKIEEIIANIKSRQTEENNDLQAYLKFKTNSAQHRYKLNTLTTNLVLDEIFKERSIILQCFRYLAKENLLENEEVKSENIINN